MKERLTDAAMDLIWENSYGATSVDAICDRAGAKKGSFYYFFKSKSELAAAALQAEWKKRRSDMDRIFSPTVPPLERLDRYFDYVHDGLAERQSKCGSVLGCPLLAVGSEISTQDQVLRNTVDRILDQKISYFVSAIRVDFTNAPRGSIHSIKHSCRTGTTIHWRIYSIRLTR